MTSIHAHWILIRSAQERNKSYVLYNAHSFNRSGVDIEFFGRAL